MNTAAPTIAGLPVQGQLLVASTGTWSGSPTNFTFLWFRCPPSGGQAGLLDCALISGATASSYTLAVADVGFRIRVRVSATNTTGSTSAISGPTALVLGTAAAPTNTAPPTITGTAVVGRP